MSIPSEGHTLPEAYDNHLIHAQRLGAYEMKHLHENKYVQAREAARKVLPKATYKILGFDESIKFHKVRYEFYWYTAGRMLTQLAREKLAEHAVKENCDYMIMYDDDMVLSPDFAIKLLETMEKHKKIDVLGALAFMRNPPHYPVIYTTTEGYDGVNHSEYYIREYVKRYPKDTLVECDAVGFGGVCIKVDLLKRLGEPWFMSTTKTGEDIWFCYRAKRDVNARIFMDTRIKMGHLKNPEVIDEDYFDKWVKENKHDLGDEVPGKYVAYAK